MLLKPRRIQPGTYYRNTIYENYDITPSNIKSIYIIEFIYTYLIEYSWYKYNLYLVIDNNVVSKETYYLNLLYYFISYINDKIITVKERIPDRIIKKKRYALSNAYSFDNYYGPKSVNKKKFFSIFFLKYFLKYPAKKFNKTIKKTKKIIITTNKKKNFIFRAVVKIKPKNNYYQLINVTNKNIKNTSISIIKNSRKKIVSIKYLKVLRMKKQKYLTKIKRLKLIFRFGKKKKFCAKTILSKNSFFLVNTKLKNTTFWIWFDYIVRNIYKKKIIILKKALLQFYVNRISNKLEHYNYRYYYKNIFFLWKNKKNYWLFDLLVLIDYTLDLGNISIFLTYYYNWSRRIFQHTRDLKRLTYIIKQLYIRKSYISGIKIIVSGVFNKHSRSKVFYWQIGLFITSNVLDNTVLYDAIEYPLEYGVYTVHLWIIYNNNYLSKLSIIK